MKLTTKEFCGVVQVMSDHRRGTRICVNGALNCTRCRKLFNANPFTNVLCPDQIHGWSGTRWWDEIGALLKRSL